MLPGVGRGHSVDPPAPDDELLEVTPADALLWALEELLLPEAPPADELLGPPAVLLLDVLLLAAPPPDEPLEDAVVCPLVAVLDDALTDTPLCAFEALLATLLADEALRLEEAA